MKVNSINECKIKNETVLALEKWAKNLVTIGTIIFAFMAISALVSGIAAASTYENEGFSAFISAFFPQLLWAVIELASFLAISILLKALASITHNTEVTAKLTELCASNKGIPYGDDITAAPANVNYRFSKPTKSAQAPYTPTVYICETCGEKSQDMFCSVCGKKKIKESEHISKKAETKTPQNNEWKCPSCGKINQNYVGTCGCGEKKPLATQAPLAADT